MADVAVGGRGQRPKLKGCLSLATGRRRTDAANNLQHCVSFCACSFDVYTPVTLPHTLKGPSRKACRADFCNPGAYWTEAAILWQLHLFLKSSASCPLHDRIYSMKSKRMGQALANFFCETLRMRVGTICLSHPQLLDVLDVLYTETFLLMDCHSEHAKTFFPLVWHVDLFAQDHPRKKYAWHQIGHHGR